MIVFMHSVVTKQPLKIALTQTNFISKIILKYFLYSSLYLFLFCQLFGLKGFDLCLTKVEK